MHTFACRSGGRTVAYIASEALCFFHTENFDNSHEKMEKRGRSSLGVEFIGSVPLTSYKGLGCSSNLFSAVEGHRWISGHKFTPSFVVFIIKI